MICLNCPLSVLLLLLLCVSCSVLFCCVLFYHLSGCGCACCLPACAACCSRHHLEQYTYICMYMYIYTYINIYMGRTRSLYRIIINVGVAANKRGSIRPTNLLFAYSKISLKIVYSLVWHEMKVSFGPTNVLIPFLLPLLQCS